MLVLLCVFLLLHHLLGKVEGAQEVLMYCLECAILCCLSEARRTVQGSPGVALKKRLDAVAEHKGEGKQHAAEGHPHMLEVDLRSPRRICCVSEHTAASIVRTCGPSS